MNGDARVSRLLEAVLLVARDLDLETVLQRVVEAGCALVDARYGALGVISEDDTGLAAFVHHGMDTALVERIGQLPAGHGILGLLIEDPRPLRIDDLRTHPSAHGFPEQHPPMASFLGVPVRVGERVFGNLYLTEKHGGGAFTAADEQLAVGLAAVAGAVIFNARLLDDLRRREAWRDAIQEVGALVLAGEPSGVVRQRVAHLAVGLVDAEVGCLVAADPDAEGALDILAAAGTDVAPGTVVAPRSAAWRTLRTGDPVRVEHGQIMRRPAMWVPVRLGTDVVAALGVGRDEPFTPREEHLLQGFGNQASLVWTYERSQDEVRRLSLVEERERIGRDLHDTVIQRLFATGLSLQAVLRGLEDRPEAADRVRRSVDDIDKTVKEIRSTIFALTEPSVGETSGLRTRLLTVVDEIATLLAAPPRVRFGGPLDTLVGETIGAQLVPVLREGLTNVAKHADATDVEVEVTIEGEVVRLRVLDDGNGVDLRADGGFGVANLRERAVALGGRFELRSRVDARGTELLWEVPVG